MYVSNEMYVFDILVLIQIPNVRDQRKRKEIIDSYEHFFVHCLKWCNKTGVSFKQFINEKDCVYSL